MKNFFHYLPLSCLILTQILVSPPVLALTSYETVISDTSFTSSSRVIIDEAQIRSSRAANLTGLLASQANISISATSFLPNSIYLRGGDPSHILFLVDGVPYYDASTSQRTINLNTIDLKSIRRIEVIRGSQSVLYGGQALTGVIKIETFPLVLKTNTQAQAQAGSNNLQQESVSHLQALNESSALGLRASHLAKNSKSPVPDSDYRYPSRTATAEVSYLNRNDSEFIVKLNASNINSALAGGDPTYATYAARDTVDFKEVSTFLGTTAIYRNLEGPLKPRLSFNFLNADRAYTQSAANALNGTEARDLYGAQSISSRLDVNFITTKSWRFDAGLSTAFESVTWRQLGVETTNSYQEFYGAFVKADWFTNDNLTLSFGSRLELYSKIYGANTNQIGLNWKNLTKFEIASGFKSPSVYQLYGYNGNSELKPETSLSYSFTQDFPLAEDQGLSATIYQTEFKDLIVATGTPRKNSNLARTQARGIELAYMEQLPTETKLSFSLGYQEPYDVTNARWLVRRPLQSGSAKLIQKFENHSASLELFGNGERLDNASSSRIVTLPGYTVLNASYSYALPSVDRQLSLFTRLNNLLDRRFDDSFGFQNEGFTAALGIELQN